MAFLPGSNLAARGLSWEANVAAIVLSFAMQLAMNTLVFLIVYGLKSFILRRVGVTKLFKP